MPLSPATRDDLKKLYNALEDRVLEPGDPVYVKQIHPSSDAIEEIATEVDWQEGGGVSLFTGQRGTGKSTELKRLKKRLEELGMVVFYADLSEFMLLTKPVEVSDFLISVAGAMSEQLIARYGASPGERSYWDRLSGFLQTKVEFTDIGVKLAAVDIKASLKSDPDIKRRVQEGARGHIAQLVQEVHGFLGEAVDLVRQKEGDATRKVVLLVDSVERIRSVGPEAPTVYDSVRNLFFGHGEHLRVPVLHVVYTVPPYLSVLASGAGVGRRFLDGWRHGASLGQHAYFQRPFARSRPGGFGDHAQRCRAALRKMGNGVSTGRDQQARHQFGRRLTRIFSAGAAMLDGGTRRRRSAVVGWGRQAGGERGAQ